MLFYFLQKVRSNSTQNIVTLTQRKITCFSEKKALQKVRVFFLLLKNIDNLPCSLFALFRETRNSNTCAANLLRNSTVYTILYKSYVKFQYSPSCLLEVRVNKQGSVSGMADPTTRRALRYCEPFSCLQKHFHSSKIQ